MRWTSWVVSGVSLGFASSAWAVPPLSTPWPCEISYRVTQGHNTGSHTDKGAWAWDIGVPEGAEVTAPADGLVRRIRMDSSRGGCSSTFANDANYVVIDFQDGTEALLLHLQPNSSQLKVGDAVRRGDVVGKVGLTGWVCGAHLHFQIQQTCDSWWCQSIPASFASYGDPSSGALVSDNCPDCSAQVRASEPVVVDETDPACFKRQTTYWWSVAEGHRDHHYYTFATDAAAPDTVGTWQFHVADAGAYRVEVHVPQTEADAQNVAYEIQGGMGANTVAGVNQAASKGWVDLGVFDMAADTPGYVRVNDNTGEAYDLRRKIAFDALRISPLVADVGEDMGSMMDAGTPDVGADDTGMLGEPTEPAATDAGLDAEVATPARVQVESGCATAVSGGAAWGLLLVALGWRRRQ